MRELVCASSEALKRSVVSPHCKCRFIHVTMKLVRDRIDNCEALSFHDSPLFLVLRKSSRSKYKWLHNAVGVDCEITAPSPSSDASVSRTNLAFRAGYANTVFRHYFVDFV